MSLPPGPRAPAAVQTAALMRDPHGFFTRLHRRHGWAATIRILGEGRVICVADPEWAKATFSDPDGLSAGQAANTLEPIVGKASLLTLDGHEHLRQRKLLLPPFHGEALRGYEAAIREIARSEAAAWPVGEPFALHVAMQRATLQMILRIVFGVTDPAQLERFTELQHRLVKLANVAVLPRALRADRGGRATPGGRFHAAMREFDAQIHEQIAARRASIASANGDGGDAHEPDVLGLLLQARDEDGAPLTDAELRDELVTLLVAGHETTATAMAWTFDLLLHDQRALADATEAARRGDVPYLEAVAREALRLRPVIFSHGRIAQQDTSILGWSVPKRTRVWAPYPVLHRNPALWEEPDAWRPERWTNGTTAAPYSWLPFGGGIRRCIGAAFALLEMRLLLDEILTTVTLRADGPPERAALRNVVAAPRKGVRVVRTA